MKKETWRPGIPFDAIVREDPPDDMRVDEGNFNHYGGYVLCESVHPQFKPLLLAAPDLQDVLTELIRRKKECEENLSSYMEAKILAALAKANGGAS